MDFGYIRVCSNLDDAGLQIKALTKGGLEKKNLFHDVASVAKSKWPELDRLLANVKATDRIFVWRSDRIAKSLPHFIWLVNSLHKKGISLISLSEPLINTSLENPDAKVITNILNWFEEFEQNLHQEQNNHNENVSRRNKSKLGRPKGVSSETMEKYHRAKDMYDNKDYTVKEICRMCKISKPRFYAILKEQRNQQELLNLSNLKLTENADKH